jgi:hypothetical protein
MIRMDGIDRIVHKAKPASVGALTGLKLMQSAGGPFARRARDNSLLADSAPGRNPGVMPCISVPFSPSGTLP